MEQKDPIHSINQSIYNLLLILIDSTDQSSNQSINWSAYQSRDMNKSVLIFFDFFEFF